VNATFRAETEGEHHAGDKRPRAAAAKTSGADSPTTPDAVERTVARTMPAMAPEPTVESAADCWYLPRFKRTRRKSQPTREADNQSREPERRVGANRQKHRENQRNHCEEQMPRASDIHVRATR
jgi:hypothetical protein